MKTGTIYPDGRVRWHGYTDDGVRLLNISRDAITTHNPGGRYWDNGGGHYVSAWIDVYQIVELRRANEAGQWIVSVGRCLATFHPTPKIASKIACDRLENRGDQIAEQIAKRKDTP